MWAFLTCLHIICIQHTDNEKVVKNLFEYVETKAATEAHYIGALSQNDTHTAAFPQRAVVPA